MLTKQRHSSCTNSILPGQDCPLVPCVCADRSGYRGHTLWQSKQVCYGNVLALLERFYRTYGRYEQTSPLASLEVWWLAPAPAWQAFRNARRFRANRSIDNASLAVAMARGIKTILLYAHGPTVLTNPEPCSAARS